MSTGINQGARSGGRSDIAICGIGCIFPQADNLEAYWDNIKKGVNSITDVPKATHWSPEDYLDTDPKAPDKTYAARGGFISPIEFNPMEYGIAPKDIEATDTTQIFGMIAAREALRDAGYWEGKHFDRSRTSVILGVTGTLELAIPLGARLGHPIWRRALRESGLDAQVTQEVIERIADGYVDWQENSFPGLLGNVAAGRIANRFDLGGTNCVVDAACASSLSALHLAELELASGKADMVLTGGIDTFNNIFMYMCFSKTPALSPTGDAKPFSKDCDGTILGEGIGILVLKRLADAERDGDKIYAVIKGIGTSSDGKGNAIYAPSAKGQVKALRRAYEIAGVKPSTIELVEAHGTGTRVGDATEVAALTEVFSADGRPGSWCALGSVKSQIGHTKAASGVAALIKVAMALHHRVLPPTIKVTEPLDGAAPGKSPFYVNTIKRPWVGTPAHPRRAAVSSFGFGGSNFHCVLEEAPQTKAVTSSEIAHQIIAFSGSDPGAILKKLESVPSSGKWTEVREFAARTRSTFDTKSPYRLFLVCSNAPGSLAKALASARRNLESKPGSERWSTPEGAIFGHAESDGNLAMFFPGQGSQYVGMMRDLACQFTGFQGVFEGANSAFSASQSAPTPLRLSDYIYPLPAFDKDATQHQTEQLKQTQIAQPAIGAVCLGGLQVLGEFGLVADVVAGHSFGELVALHAAGRMDAATLHLLSNFRGNLMAEASRAKEAGGMLVVKASLETVQELLDREECGLVIANHNAPDQIVLAGTLEAIHKTSALFSEQSIWNRTLPVSAAFHSPLVAGAREPFLARLKQVEIRTGRLPVWANTTADVYPDPAEEVQALLAGQLAQPVRFVEQVQAMYEVGVRTFVEVGPGNVLAGLIKAILDGKKVTVVSLDGSMGRQDGMHDLALTLCEVAASGHPVNLAHWDEEFSRSPDRQREQKSKLSVLICGANQRSPKPQQPSKCGVRGAECAVTIALPQTSSPPMTHKTAPMIALSRSTTHAP
ncbi:MAG: beta-ketoacyl synthase N-terminal-like domain-containing protein, partial [Verrucomicrobia bacterium]|nr:beta-ketoacyl synthase N-terminal-like domain-containing protein [Verrucomicrobiota bacterium]